MGYKYNGDDVMRLCNSTFIEAINGIVSALKTLEEDLQRAYQDEAWKGKAADRFKNYHTDIYGRVMGLFYETLDTLQKKCLEYSGGYLEIDSDTYAAFDTDKLSTLRDDLFKRKEEADKIHTAVNTQITNVRGIVSINYVDPGVRDRLSKMHNCVKNLVTDVESREAEYPKGFGTIDDLINSLNQVIADGKSVQVSSDGRTIAYNPSKFIKTYKQVAEAYQSNKKYLDEHAEEIEKNIELNQDALDRRQKDLEERQRAAFGLSIVIGIVGAAVTIATAGAAGPVVAIAVGAGVGAVSGFANSVATQSVGDLYGHGVDKVNWGEAFKEAAVEGTIGAVTGAIGAGSAKLVANSAKLAHPVAAKIAIKTGEKVLTGMASRMISTTADEGLAAGLEDAFDYKSIIGDAASGAAGATVGEIVDKVDDTKLGKLAEKNKLVNYGTELVKDEVTDMAKRGAKTYATTGDINQAMNDALDGEEMIKSGVSSVTSNVEKDLVTARRNSVANRRSPSDPSMRKEEMEGVGKGEQKILTERQEKALNKEEAAVEKRANDPTFQAAQNANADRKAEKSYKNDLKEGKVSSYQSKDTYVREKASESKNPQAYEKAARKEYEKSVTSPYEKAVSNAFETGIDHFSDGEENPKPVEIEQDYDDILSNY